MEAVYFSNSGLIDLDVIRVMGVSVKETANPIGYFGTGLKFAIATLLRNGQRVTLIRGGERFSFSVRPSTIRGEQFDRVYMNDEPLPFTTDLGRNWQVWQAYRELHSNTLDECGRITDEAREDDTVIIAEGDAIWREFLNRDKIFVMTKPIAANASIEAHPGPSQAIFYRGVRAGFLPEPAKFAYNILVDMQLTEDRTFASQWDVEWKLGTLIPTLDHRGVAADLLEGTEAWDQNVDFSRCIDPSPEFLEAAASRYNDASAPAAAKRIVERDMQRRAEFPPATLSDREHAMFLDAFTHLGALGCSLSPEDVEIVESLGPNTFAMHHKGRDQIYLAKHSMDWGMQTVVAALYEEWLHKVYHYQDRTTALQNFLFQRLVALAMGAEAPAPEDQRTMPF